jgi:hypothetical protein
MQMQILERVFEKVRVGDLEGIKSIIRDSGSNDSDTTIFESKYELDISQLELNSLEKTDNNNEREVNIQNKTQTLLIST